MAVGNIVFGVEQDDVFALEAPVRNAIELYIGFSVSAVNRELYQNYKPPRHRGYYGFAQLMAGAFVLQTIQLEFVNQLLYYNLFPGVQLADSIACFERRITECACSAITTPVNVFLVKTPLTSVRFRLAPGVLGNCVVRYLTFESGCGNIGEPQPDQGVPPAPDNGTYNPGSQPPGSESDPYDPTGNDGTDPDAPKPELPGSGGYWKTVVQAVDPDFPPYTFTVPGNASDDYQVVPSAPRTDVPGETCKGRYKGTLNGAQVWITDNCTSTINIITEKEYVAV